MNYFATVPIVPQVSGQVIEVTDRVNEVLEKSDVLLKLDPIPYKAKVDEVLPAMAQGQVPASGVLIDGSTLVHRVPGRIAVRFYIDDDNFEQYQDQLPGGAYGQAAIYSEHMHHVAIMRRVLLRMSSWMNFFFPFH